MELTDYRTWLLEVCSSPSPADHLKDISSSPLEPYFYGLQYDFPTLGPVSGGQSPSLCMQWNPHLTRAIIGGLLSGPSFGMGTSTNDLGSYYPYL